MAARYELPNCQRRSVPTLIRPRFPTPSHTLYLSNLDDWMLYRFPVNYILLFPSAPNVESMKSSLAAVLDHYYPLAGRLRQSREDEKKLELECTAEGALFVEASMDATADMFQQLSRLTGSSLLTLHHEVGDQTSVSVPLAIQATHLRCGALVVCASIFHCLCDGFGSSQFLNAWADACRDPTSPISIKPCWGRDALKPRNPPRMDFPCGFDWTEPVPRFGSASAADEPLVPVFVTFEADQICRLKSCCVPSLNCTSFEVLSAHIWRCWARAMFQVEPSNQPTCSSNKMGQVVRLMFPVNVRAQMDPPLPAGFYGNGFVATYVDHCIEELLAEQIDQTVKGIQSAKEVARSDAYARSLIDLLAVHQPATEENSNLLVISEWSKLGLEKVDFGSGPPALISRSGYDRFCILLPIAGKPKAAAIYGLMPESKACAFEFYLRKLGDAQPDEKEAAEV